MKIHPRYFNKFIVIVAVTAAITIAVTTFFHLQNREEQFRQRMKQMDSESLYSTSFYHFARADSMRLDEFRGRFLLLDFWAGWSGPALESHEKLSEFRSGFPGSLDVVAASVREDADFVSDYVNSHDYEFEFVEGTRFFERMEIPGVPSQVLIAPDGVVIEAFVGYIDSTRYDHLNELIKNP